MPPRAVSGGYSCDTRQMRIPLNPSGRTPPGACCRELAVGRETQARAPVRQPLAAVVVAPQVTAQLLLEAEARVVVAAVQAVRAELLVDPGDGPEHRGDVREVGVGAGAAHAVPALDLGQRHDLVEELARPGVAAGRRRGVALGPARQDAVAQLAVAELAVG